MKSRSIQAVLVTGLVLALLPAGAAGQAGTAEGELEYMVEVTCEYGQGSPRELPSCEFDSSGAFLTMRNLGRMTGTFDGVAVLDAIVLTRAEDASAEFTGSVLFAGTVEGCGTGTAYFDVVGTAVSDENGINTYPLNTQTSASGGTLPLEAAIDLSGTEVVHENGTRTLGYTGTYACN